jgi:dCMP deaminase
MKMANLLEGNKKNYYFGNIAYIVAEQATCLSAAKGAVIVRDGKFIISTGYNGAPMGVGSCLDKNQCHKRALGFGHGEGHHVCLASHAEANAIIIAARLGASTEGATMYCTHKPCFSCAKMIINSGIKTVIFIEDYPDQYTEDILEQAGVELFQLFY